MLLLGEGSEATEPYNKHANLFKYICYLINLINPFCRHSCRPCDRRHIVAQMAGDEMSLTLQILLSEVEQEQRLSRNRDREAIVVGAGLCDGGGERGYTAYAPHYNHFASRTNVFSCLEDVSATKTFQSNSTAFHSIPTIRSKGSTSVLSTRIILTVYSHPMF